MTTARATSESAETEDVSLAGMGPRLAPEVPGARCVNPQPAPGGQQLWSATHGHHLTTHPEAVSIFTIIVYFRITIPNVCKNMCGAQQIPAFPLLRNHCSQACVE